MSREATPPQRDHHKSYSTHSRSQRKSRGSRMTSFGHSKPCQKTMYIYASLSLIISLIKLMSVNYGYNNKKNLTCIFMKGTGCYILPNLQKFRPRNLRHTWTEEYPETSSHHTSSCHTGGPCPLMCPEHRCQRSGPAPQGWLPLTQESDLSSVGTTCRSPVQTGQTLTT